jgi:hypothetical protein
VYIHSDKQPNILKMFFWVVASCGLVGRYQRFGETSCLQSHGWHLNLSLRGVTTQSSIVITVVKTSNLAAKYFVSAQYEKEGIEIHVCLYYAYSTLWA